MSFAPSGELLAVGSRGTELAVFHVDTGDRVLSLEHGAEVRGVAFNPVMGLGFSHVFNRKDDPKGSGSWFSSWWGGSQMGAQASQTAGGPPGLQKGISRGSVSGSRPLLLQKKWGSFCGLQYNSFNGVEGSEVDSAPVLYSSSLDKRVKAWSALDSQNAKSAINFWSYEPMPIRSPHRMHPAAASPSPRMRR